MKLETFEKALEKLWAHRGAELSGENVSRGASGWREAYLAQRAHRGSQLETMTRLAGAPGCRMLALVGHFGDRADSGEPCALCDSCRPEDACVAEVKREASEAERVAVTRILAALAGSELSAGKLFQEVPGMERRDFERLLSELQRQGWVEVRIESFEKDGETIEYRRARLTERGGTAGRAELEALKLPDIATASRKKKPSALKHTGRDSSLSADEEALRGSQLFGRLREWRKGEARTKGVPAFRILPDRVLLEICASRPSNEGELLAVRGLGPKLVERYGDVLLQSVRSH
jgi:superfamily II DNA helicase RecQ